LGTAPLPAVIKTQTRTHTHTHTHTHTPPADPNFDLRRMLNCVSVQAVPHVTDAGVQAAAARPRPNAAQTSPLDLTVAEKGEATKSRGKYTSGSAF
jgi:hypothetical protein